MKPIEGSLYSVLVEIRETQRRCREANREDLVIQLETLRSQLIEMRARCAGI